jgi:hypothetical protein
MREDHACRKSSGIVRIVRRRAATQIFEMVSQGVYRFESAIFSGVSVVLPLA